VADHLGADLIQIARLDINFTQPLERFPQQRGLAVRTTGTVDQRQQRRQIAHVVDAFPQCFPAQRINHAILSPPHIAPGPGLGGDGSNHVIV